MLPHRLHEILIDFTAVLPSLILEFIPGTINDLHFLQNINLRSYGIRMLCLLLIFLASMAWRCESRGSVLAFEMALLMSMCIRSKAILLREGLMSDMSPADYKLLCIMLKNAVSGIRTRVAGLETPNTNQAIL